MSRGFLVWVWVWVWVGGAYERSEKAGLFGGFSLLSEMPARGFLNSTNRIRVGPGGLLLLLLRLLRCFFLEEFVMF